MSESHDYYYERWWFCQDTNRMMSDEGVTVSGDQALQHQAADRPFQNQPQLGEGMAALTFA